MFRHYHRFFTAGRICRLCSVLLLLSAVLLSAACGRETKSGGSSYLIPDTAAMILYDRINDCSCVIRDGALLMGGIEGSPYAEYCASPDGHSMLFRTDNHLCAVADDTAELWQYSYRAGICTDGSRGFLTGEGNRSYLLYTWNLKNDFRRTTVSESVLNSISTVMSPNGDAIICREKDGLVAYFEEVREVLTDNEDCYPICVSDKGGVYLLDANTFALYYAFVGDSELTKIASSCREDSLYVNTRCDEIIFESDSVEYRSVRGGEKTETGDMTEVTVLIPSYSLRTAPFGTHFGIRYVPVSSFENIFVCGMTENGFSVGFMDKSGSIRVIAETVEKSYFGSLDFWGDEYHSELSPDGSCLYYVKDETLYAVSADNPDSPKKLTLLRAGGREGDRFFVLKNGEAALEITPGGEVWLTRKDGGSSLVGHSSGDALIYGDRLFCIGYGDDLYAVDASGNSVHIDSYVRFVTQCGGCTIAYRKYDETIFASDKAEVFVPVN